MFSLKMFFVVLSVLLGLLNAASLFPKPDASQLSAASVPLAELDDMEVAATAYRHDKHYNNKGYKQYDYGHHDQHHQKNKHYNNQYKHHY